MKSIFVLTLAAAMTSLFAGSALAGESSQRKTATVRSEPAPRVEYKQIWDNRGQLIAVIPVASR